MTTSPSEPSPSLSRDPEVKSRTENSKKKKKKRVSKHVIQALKDKEEMKLQLQKQQQEHTLANPSSKSTKEKKKEKKIVKDPSEAAQYLTTWNENRNEWKFNKNTQSWLIRHMYESDKINKNTFTLLLEYLKGLHGSSTKTRILTDATRRAFRYKEYEKNSQQQITEKDERHGENQKEAGPNGDNKTLTVSSDDGGEGDETRWKALSDHDKRKEYKRARKVLETFNE